MMFQTIHDDGYTEQDILDGSADLYEIVKRFKDIHELFFHLFSIVLILEQNEALKNSRHSDIQRRAKICHRVFVSA